MSNFDTNAEEFYQRHVRPSLAEYAQYHLCMDYIEVTETMVAALLSPVLKQISAHDPTSLIPPIDPLRFFAQKHGLDLEATRADCLIRSREYILEKSKLEVRKESVTFIKSSLPRNVPANELKSERSCWDEPPEVLVAGRMSPVLTMRARKETQPNVKRVEASICPETLHLVPVEEDQVLDPNEILNTKWSASKSDEKELRSLLRETAAMIRLIPNRPAPYQAFLNGEYPPPNDSSDRPLLCELDFVPIFPKKDRPGYIGLQGKQKLDFADLPRLLPLVESMEESDSEIIKRGNLAIIHGWETFASSPISSLSSLLSQEDQFHEIRFSTPPTEHAALDDYFMDVPIIPRTKRIFGTSDEKPKGVGYGQGLPEFLERYLAPIRDRGITTDDTIASANGEASNPESAAHIPTMTHALQDDAQLHNEIKRLYQDEGDPLDFVRCEKLGIGGDLVEKTADDSPSVITVIEFMDVPNLPPPTDRPPGQHPFPKSLRDLLLGGAEHAETPAVFQFLKKVKGIQSLNVSLPWTPFVERTRIPTQVEIARVNHLFSNDCASSEFTAGNEMFISPRELEQIQVLLGSACGITPKEWAPDVIEQSPGDVATMLGASIAEFLNVDIQLTREEREMKMRRARNDMTSLTAQLEPMTPERSPVLSNSGRPSKRRKVEHNPNQNWSPTITAPASEASSHDFSLSRIPENVRSEVQKEPEIIHDRMVLAGDETGVGSYYDDFVDPDFADFPDLWNDGFDGDDLTFAPIEYAESKSAATNVITESLDYVQVNGYAGHPSHMNLDDDSPYHFTVEQMDAVPALATTLSPTVASIPALAPTTPTVNALDNSVFGNFFGFATENAQINAMPPPHSTTPISQATTLKTPDLSPILRDPKEIHNDLNSSNKTPSIPDWLADSSTRLSAFAQLRARKLTSFDPVGERNKEIKELEDRQIKQHKEEVERLRTMYRGPPVDILDDRTMSVPPAECFEWNSGHPHKYLASLGFIQFRGLVNALQSSPYQVFLSERDSLGTTTIESGDSTIVTTTIPGVDLILDPHTAIIRASLFSLSYECEILVQQVSQASWRFAHILIIFEAFPESHAKTVRILGRQYHQRELDQSMLPYAFTPPIIKALKRFKRDLVIAEGLGSMRGWSTLDPTAPGSVQIQTTVMWGYAVTLEDEAALCRRFGDDAERRSRESVMAVDVTVEGGADGLAVEGTYDARAVAVDAVDWLWGDREWLEYDVSEDEGDLALVPGMNNFSASIVLLRITLEQFLELDSERRVDVYGPYVGYHVMDGFNHWLEGKASAIEEMGG